MKRMRKRKKRKKRAKKPETNLCQRGSFLAKKKMFTSWMQSLLEILAAISTTLALPMSLFKIALLTHMISGSRGSHSFLQLSFELVLSFAGTIATLSIRLKAKKFTANVELTNAGEDYYKSK